MLVAIIVEGAAIVALFILLCILAARLNSYRVAMLKLNMYISAVSDDVNMIKEYVGGVNNVSSNK